MKCPLCGAQVSKDDLFCEGCGHNLIQERPGEEQAALPPAPAESASAAIPAETAPLPEGAPVADTATPVVQPAAAPAGQTRGFVLPPDNGAVPPRARDNKTWLWIAIAVIVLIVVLCCCCIGVFILAAASSESGYNSLWPGIAPFLR